MNTCLTYPCHRKVIETRFHLLLFHLYHQVWPTPATVRWLKLSSGSVQSVVESSDLPLPPQGDWNVIVILSFTNSSRVWPTPATARWLKLAMIVPECLSTNSLTYPCHREVIETMDYSCSSLFSVKSDLPMPPQGDWNYTPVMCLVPRLMSEAPMPP